MDLVEFLGITFRSTSHMRWFVITMTAIAITIAVSFVSVIWRKNYEFPRSLWFSFGMSSIFTSLSAVVVTKFGTTNGPIYSVDCIWYNGLIAGICFSAIALLFALRGGHRHQ